MDDDFLIGRFSVKFRHFLCSLGVGRRMSRRRRRRRKKRRNKIRRRRREKSLRMAGFWMHQVRKRENDDLYEYELFPGQSCAEEGF